MDQTTAKAATPLALWPLMFERLASAMAMMAFVALAGPLGRLLHLADWQIGAVISAAALTWLAFAGAWGRISDRRGRRPVILVALTGFVVCYGLLCVVVGMALTGALSALVVFAGLLLWRGMAGAFYAGVLPSSMALIADRTTPEKRAGSMAMLGAASGAGMVAGPALVGLLSPWGLAFPLYLLGLLPLLALLVLWRKLPRATTAATPPRAPVRVTDKRLRGLVAVAFGAMVSVTMAQVCVGFYAIDRLGLDAAEGGRVAGWTLACVGLALSGSQWLVRRLGWPPQTLLLRGLLLAAAGFFLVVFADRAGWLYGGYFVAACGMGWIWPSLSALAAGQVGPGEQGAAAGAVSSAQAMGAVLGPIGGTTLYAVAAVLPYLFITLLLGLLALWQWYRFARPRFSST